MYNSILNGLVDDDEFSQLIGPEIGRSSARAAFEVQGHPNFATKMAPRPGAFSNCAEYS